MQLPRLLQSDTIYRGRTFLLRVDEIELGPGRSVKLDIVQHTGAVTMVPLDADGSIWFIRQYRHSTGGVILELPAGTLGRDEDPLAGAQRELQEEIGMKAGQWERLTSMWLAPGYSTEYLHLYLATNLATSRLEPDEDEMITVEKIPIARALALADRGELQDSKSLVGLYAAARKLGW